MQIKPLRSMVGSYGKIRKGIEATVDDHIAQQLVRRGVAVPAQTGEGAKQASARPSKDARHGGRTGGGKQSSSLPGGQASKASRSTR